MFYHDMSWHNEFSYHQLCQGGLRSESPEPVWKKKLSITSSSKFLRGKGDFISYLMREVQVQARFSVHIWRGEAESDMRQGIWIEPVNTRTNQRMESGMSGSSQILCFISPWLSFASSGMNKEFGLNLTLPHQITYNNRFLSQSAYVAK